MDAITHKPHLDVEILQRARRIETRVTQLLVHLGIDAGAQKPIFDPGNLQGRATVTLPSRHSSLAEIIAAIPETFAGPVDVFIGGERIAVLDRAP